MLKAPEKTHRQHRKKSNYYHWWYRDVNGRTKSEVVKNSSGGKILDRAEAEQIVEQWAKDLFALQLLKSKEQIIRHIAEATYKKYPDARLNFYVPRNFYQYLLQV